MSYKIRVEFLGDAPDGELERARIIAGDAVQDAIGVLSKALEAAGLKHKVTAHSIRLTPRRSAKQRAAASAEAARMVPRDRLVPDIEAAE